MFRGVRITGAALVVLLIATAAGSETRTLPAAASIQGLAPFFTDVRVFNTSYTASLEVTAAYRCFLGTCPSAPSPMTLTLAPRHSQAFDDMVAATFAAPDSGGGIEFVFDGPEKNLVVTSRLYSTVPTPTVGMFVPGLAASRARRTSVLTSLRNRGAGAGFRTNAGVFNPGDGTVGVTFHLLADGLPVGSPVVRSVPAHSGVQVNAIYAVAGASDAETANGAIVADATGPVFAYAAVIDNETTDPYFVIGASDEPYRTPTPTNTFTPSLTPTITSTTTTTFTATITPTRTPSRTPTPNPNHIVLVGPDDTNTFRDSISGTTITTITVGQTVEWQWVSGYHSTTSGNCPNNFCSPDGNWSSTNESPPFTFTHTFDTVATYNYYCMQHGAAMQGAVNVLPAGVRPRASGSR